MNPENQNNDNNADATDGLQPASEVPVQPSQQVEPKKIDPASIYPTAVDSKVEAPPSFTTTNPGSMQNPQTKKRMFTFKKLFVLGIVFAAVGLGFYYFMPSNKNTGKTIAGDYSPSFTVYAPSYLPDSSYYLQGIITPETKPVGTQSGITLYYRSKNVSENADFTLDSSIFKISEDVVKQGYLPPESCANVDTVPTNKTPCQEVGKMTSGESIYRWPSTAQPLLQVGINGTFISVDIPQKGTVSVDELVKITQSLTSTSFDDLLNQVKP